MNRQMLSAFTGLALFLIASADVSAVVSSGNLNDITPVCIGSALTFSAETNEADARNTNPGHAYGTLITAPNPAWFYFKVDVGGSLILDQTNSANKDVDGALWGPFDSVQDMIRDGVSASYEPALLLDSDYDPAAGFSFNTSVTAGKFYALLIANYSSEATEISLSSGAGTAATTDCSITYGLDLTFDGATTSTTESGISDSYTISLYRQPAVNVTVDIASTTSEAIASSSSLLFTPTDWDVPQTVTLTAVDDAILDGNLSDTITNTASSADANYNGLTSDVPVVAIDDNDLAIPTVAALSTNDNTPLLTGSHTSAAVLTALVNAVPYTEGDGNLNDNGNGSWSLQIGGALPDATYDVSVTSTSTNNALSDTSSAELVIDATDPEPTLAINSVTTDNIVNAAEAGGNVQLGGIVTGEYITGDTVTLTINSTPYTGNVDAAGSFNITIPGASLVAATVVDASITTTDSFGNIGTDTVQLNYTVDTVLPVPTIELDSISADNIVNISEAGSTINVTGAVAGDFNNGDSVALNVNGNSYAGAVNAGGLFSIVVSGADLADDSSISASVSTVDSAGNPATGNTVQSYSVDISSPVLSISSNDITADNIINANESASSITLDGQLSGDFNVGDIVTITAASNSYTGPVDAAGVYSIVIPGNVLATVTTLDASVSTSDSAGNPAIAAVIQRYAVDTTPPVPVIALNPVTADNIVNASETSAVISISGSVSGDYAAGDVVTVTINSNVLNTTLDSAGLFSVDASGADLASDITVAASVSTSDTSGNSSTVNASSAYIVDIIAPQIGAADVALGNDVTPVLSGTSDEPAGSTVTVTDSTGGAVCSGIVVADTPLNSWSCTSTGNLAEGSNTLTATIVDAAGNSASESLTAVVDTIAPDVSGVSLAAISSSAPLLAGTSDAAVGSTVLIEDAQGAAVCSATVTAGGSWNCTPDNTFVAGSYELTANLVDDAGNKGSALFTVVVDFDQDNDGIPDSLEGTADSDFDGVPDYLDTDSDNDGISDDFEETSLPQLDGADSDRDGVDDAIDVDLTGGNDVNTNGVDDLFEPIDTDGDLLPDYLDTDSDNDGIPDIVETNADSDSDGFANFIDTDADGDGIDDSTEDSSTPVLIGTDSDADGIDDAIDVNVTGGIDANSNGIDDALEVTDTDGDLIPDYLDVDSDGDNIADLIEGLNDPDNDGIAAYLDSDSDDDLIPDLIEGSNDTDNDGIPDFLDLDSDGDSLPDRFEALGGPGNADDDGDGIANHLDSDADNDGLLDRHEGSVDTDADGVPDFRDTDSDNDGLFDVIEGDIDTDGDGVLNAFDTDSDGDGIPDDVEVGEDVQNPRDTDGDGVADLLDLDADNDGIPDSVEAGMRAGVLLDSDNDGIPDIRDLDSDNDGLTDALEANAGDADGNGIVDGFIDNNGDGLDDALGIMPLTVDDTDSDGIRDYRDLDSDNDSLSDAIETQGVAADDNRDGRIDAFADTNGNGLDDSLEILPVSAEDIDGDGLPDQLDSDTDGDGILDIVEAGAQDLDNDGVVDSMADSDNDGIPDSSDVDLTGGIDADADGIDDSADADFNVDSTDTDGDGIIDSRDPDIDGDGFANLINDGIVFVALPDSDGNGVPDVDQVVDPALAAANGAIVTGIQSGCSIAVRSHAGAVAGSNKIVVDPMLLLLLLVSVACLLRRHLRLAGSIVGVFTVAAAGIISLGSTSGSVQAAERGIVQVAFPVPSFHYPDANRFQRRFYAGFGLGASRLTPDTSAADGVELVDSVHGSGQLMFGLDVNKWLSLEAHAADLGSAAFSSEDSVNYSLFGSSALLYVGGHRGNFNRQGISAFTRLGYIYLSNQRNQDTVNYVQSASNHSILGLGLEYARRNGLGIRAEGIHVGQDVSYAQLSLLYRFGKRQSQKPVMTITQRSSWVPAYQSVSAIAVAPIARPDPANKVSDADFCDNTEHGASATYMGCGPFNHVLDGVNFQSASSALTPLAQVKLAELVQVLQAHPAMQFVISAHTDNQGNTVANQTLSRQRVATVGRFLRDSGISTTRFQLRAFGDSRPIADNNTVEGRRINRRVELRSVED